MDKSTKYTLQKVLAKLTFSVCRKENNSNRRRREIRSQLETILAYAQLISNHSSAITDDEIAAAINVAALRVLALIEESNAALLAPASPIATKPH